MKKLKEILFVVGLFLLSSVANAQPGPPPTGGPPCWPPPCSVPIDGGISFLAAAGAVYAGKKLLRKNTKKNPE